MTAEQVYVTDIRLDPNKMIFEGVETLNSDGNPTYTVGECAAYFFGRSPHWLRWLEQQHKFVLDGDGNCQHYEPIVRRDKPAKKSWLKKGECSKCGGRVVGQRKTPKGQRVYHLEDVEEMAHALAQNGAISGTQLSNALLALQVQGKIWEII